MDAMHDAWQTQLPQRATLVVVIAATAAFLAGVLAVADMPAPARLDAAPAPARQRPLSTPEPAAPAACDFDTRVLPDELPPLCV
jgi:hypothetical protein